MRICLYLISIKKHHAFNEATGKYDIQADTDKYLAIVDVRSLVRLIEIVQNAVNE